MSLTMEDTRVEVDQEVETTNDKSNATHIVMVPKGENDENPQAYILRARIEGFPVTALCGHTWYPTKDPKNYPICQACLDIYHQPGDNREDRNELPDI